MSPLFLKNATYLDPQGCLKKGHLRIKDSFIQSIIPVNEYHEADHAGDEVMDATSYIISPGLFNSHTHIPMVLFRGLGDDLPLQDWLNKKIFPLEEKLDPEAVYISSLLGIAELIRCGCTFFADMYFFVDSIAKACSESRLKANLSLGLLDFKGDKGISDSLELYYRLKQSGYANISLFLAPHAPYTCNPKYIEKIIETAEKLHTGIHIHLNETENEIEMIRKQYQCRPIELMNKIGLFSRPTLAAHCVHTSEQERHILKDNAVLVVHNPSSNCKLSSGIAPINSYLKMGIKVAIGTDGAASNNQLNLLKEIHLASMLSKVSEKDPTSFPQEEWYNLLYKNPFSFFFPDQIQGIQPGGKADLIFIQTKRNHLFPRENILSHLMYSFQGNEIEHVLIDGSWVLKDNTIMTFDESFVLDEFSKQYRRIVSC